MSTIPSKNDDGDCAICGAWKGLHQSETFFCPKNGREETRDGHRQEWELTKFVNEKYQKMIDDIPAALQNLLEELKATKESLKFYKEMYRLEMEDHRETKRDYLAEVREVRKQLDQSLSVIVTVSSYLDSFKDQWKEGELALMGEITNLKQKLLS